MGSKVGLVVGGITSVPLLARMLPLLCFLLWCLLLLFIRLNDEDEALAA